MGRIAERMQGIESSDSFISASSIYAASMDIMRTEWDLPTGTLGC